MAEVRFRFAEKKDAALILSFIKELAAYEKMDDEVVNTKEMSPWMKPFSPISPTISFRMAARFSVSSSWVWL